jgi:hypothetical protein
MNLTNSAAARSDRAAAASVANVYVRGGQTMRVPLRPAPAGRGCVGHPEQQLIRWLNRRTAADPGFPVRVRSILLVKPGLCTACQGDLTRFLERYRLGRNLRVLTTSSAQASCGCGRCKSKAATQPRRLLLDELLGETAPLEEQSGAPMLAGEMETSAPPSSSTSPSAVIHPNIDVYAQYSLQRLLNSPDLAARADGAALLAAVQTGQLHGIYQVDQQVPARWAQERNGGWWQLLQPTHDAAVLLWASPPYTAFWPPIIVFRPGIRSNATRIDSALRRAWQLLRQVAQLKLQRPSLTPWQVKSILTKQSLLPGNQEGPWMSVVLGVEKA